MKSVVVSRLGFSSAAVLLSSLPAFASFTTVNPPTNEETHQEIFSYIYGDHFSSAGSSGLDFSDGTIYATRINDFSDVTINSAATSTGSGYQNGNDQVWSGQFLSAEVVSKFAVFAQNFGYYQGDDNTYHQVLTQTGWGYSVGGSADLSGLSGDDIRFARGGDGRIVSSGPTDNVDGQDHMVTYEITDSSQLVPEDGVQTRTFLLFFEDALASEWQHDNDFNDLVVRVTMQVGGTSVPEPASLSMLVLGGLMLKRKRR